MYRILKNLHLCTCACPHITWLVESPRVAPFHFFDIIFVVVFVVVCFFQAHFNPQVRAFGAFLLCCILGLGQAYEAGYEDWSVEDTQSWLRKIGLDRELGPGFELHEYDGRALQVSKTKTLTRVSQGTRSQYLTNPICRYLKHVISSSDQSFP